MGALEPPPRKFLIEYFLRLDAQYLPGEYCRVTVLPKIAI
jgi:hypothetical protein